MEILKFLSSHFNFKERDVGMIRVEYQQKVDSLIEEIDKYRGRVEQKLKGAHSLRVDVSHLLTLQGRLARYKTNLLKHRNSKYINTYEHVINRLKEIRENNPWLDKRDNPITADIFCGSLRGSCTVSVDCIDSKENVVNPRNRKQNTERAMSHFR
jgi:hypothetical protein